MHVIFSSSTSRSRNTQRVSVSGIVATRGTLKNRGRNFIGAICALTVLLALPCSAQDWIRTGTGLGVEKVRLAASYFKPSTQDANNAALLKTFNDTLWNDLDNAGIFEMVSKSFYPLEARATLPKCVSKPGMLLRPTHPCWLSAISVQPAPA